MSCRIVVHIIGIEILRAVWLGFWWGLHDKTVVESQATEGW